MLFQSRYYVYSFTFMIKQPLFKCIPQFLSLTYWNGPDIQVLCNITETDGEKTQTLTATDEWDCTVTQNPCQEELK